RQARRRGGAAGTCRRSDPRRRAARGSAGPRRGVEQADGDQQGGGRAGAASLFRGAVVAGGSPGARHLAAHRRPAVGVRAGLVAARDRKRIVASLASASGYGYGARSEKKLASFGLLFRTVTSWTA